MLVPVINRINFNGANIGDPFIYFGLVHVFESIFEKKFEWLIIDKFDKGKSFERFLPEIKKEGFIIVGGTPQYNNLDDWSFWYDEGIWTDYIARHRLNAFTIAGGSGHPDPGISKEDFANYCAQSKRTKRMLELRERNSALTTVRDIHSEALLNKLNIDNTRIACTGTWACAGRNIYKESDEYVAIVSPSYNHLSFEATCTSDNEERYNGPTRLLLDLFKIYKSMGKKVVVVCHALKEFKALSSVIPSSDIFFSNDYYSTLSFYSKCELVVSARLHGSLPSYGLGDTKVQMIGIDSRGFAVECLDNIGLIKLPELLKKDFKEIELFCEDTLKLNPAGDDLEREFEKYKKVLNQTRESKVFK